MLTLPVSLTLSHRELLLFCSSHAVVCFYLWLSAAAYDVGIFKNKGDNLLSL